MTRALLAGLALAAFAAAPGFAQDERPTWNFYSDTDLATLNYAIAESDDAGPTLMCELRRGRNATPGQLTLYFFPQNPVRGRTATIRLRSGQVTADVTAQVRSNEESGGAEMEGHIALTAPVLAAFAQTGRMSFTGGGETYSPPAAPRAKIAQLLTACRR